MQVVQMTSVHNRRDIRVFHKMSLSIVSHDLSVELIVADGEGNEHISGVSIHDVGKKEGNRIFRVIKAMFRVYRKAISLNADLYQFHDPELIPVGILLKLTGNKVIFDMHEHTAMQILIKEWVNPLWLRGFISKSFYLFQSITIRFFDAVLVPQQCMVDEFKKINSNTLLIANFPSEIPATPECDIRKFDINNIRLLYSGSVSEARGIFNMLDLLSELDERFSLTIAGGIGPELLAEISLHSEWKRVNHLGYVSQGELNKVYANHDIGLIMFNNVGQYYMAYALKLFEYMRSGMLVVMPDFGDWVGFNEKYNVGLNIKTNDKYSTSLALKKITSDFIDAHSKHNVDLVSSEFTWDNQKSKLVNEYRRVIEA
jgi:glycosyltransferase involved in cell wall biosynthesis